MYVRTDLPTKTGELDLFPYHATGNALATDGLEPFELA
jgi:hypothetical protein